jgi:beta-lactamase class A
MIPCAPVAGAEFGGVILPASEDRMRIFVLFAALMVLASGQAPCASDLKQQMEVISRTARGKVGAAVLMIETGESVALNGSRHFPMQSVYKLPIAMAVLRSVDQGAIRLEQKVPVSPSEMVPAGVHSPIRDKYPEGVDLSVADLLRFNVSESDGTACDVLLHLVGGSRAVNDYLRGIGVRSLVVATTESEMGRNRKAQYRNWASPEAAVELLRALHESRGLSAAGRSRLLKLMIETATGPRRIKGLLPAGTVVAHKTGTSGTVDGFTAATNDIGLVTMPDGRHLAVAVFVSDSAAGDAVRELVIAKIALAAYNYFESRRLAGPVGDSSRQH